MQVPYLQIRSMPQVQYMQIRRTLQVQHLQIRSMLQVHLKIEVSKKFPHPQIKIQFCFRYAYKMYDIKICWPSSLKNRDIFFNLENYGNHILSFSRNVIYDSFHEIWWLIISHKKHVSNLAEVSIGRVRGKNINMAVYFAW